MKSVSKLIPILATILTVDKRGNEYLMCVRLSDETYSGSFEMLSFEAKPDAGWLHNGWLNLIYHRDPKLRAGNNFPLWSVENPFLRGVAE